jgi:hypothetical protein
MASAQAACEAGNLATEYCCLRPTCRLQIDFAGASLEYYSDWLQARFRNIDATFAANRVMVSLTKFHWAVSKPPTSLMDTHRHCQPIRQTAEYPAEVLRP